MTRNPFGIVLKLSRRGNHGDESCRNVSFSISKLSWSVIVTSFLSKIGENGRHILLIAYNIYNLMNFKFWTLDSELKFWSLNFGLDTRGG